MQTGDVRMPGGRRIVLACAADAAYAMPLAVVLRSAAARLAPDARLEAWAVDAGLGHDDRARVAASAGPRVTLRWVAPERSGFEGLPLWGRMPIATYDKLTIGRWLPDDVEEAIWLDADLLVLADLAELAATPLDGQVLAATQDDRVPTLASRFGVGVHAALGLPAAAKYFNAGVLRVDLRRWREADVEGRALAYLRAHRERVYFWDQEALNVAVAGRWRELDPAWNWNPGNGRRGAVADLEGTEPRILHFSGYLKPWRYRSEGAAHRIYYEALDETAWAGWRPPRRWWTRGVGTYEASRLRRFALPLERTALAVVRATTLRYASAAEVGGAERATVQASR